MTGNELLCHFFAKICRYGLLCKVIVGWPQSAAGYYQVSLGKGGVKGAAKSFGIISHRRVLIYSDTKLGKLS